MVPSAESEVPTGGYRGQKKRLVVLGQLWAGRVPPQGPCVASSVTQKCGFTAGSGPIQVSGAKQPCK